MQKKLKDVSFFTSKLTIYKAAALRSPALVVPVKCKCRTKCNTRQCNCIKNHVKCTQYYHTGHLEYGNLLESLAEQTEVPLVLWTQKPADPPKRKHLALTPKSKPAKKRSFVDQTVPPPTFAKSQGLQPSVSTSFATRRKSNKSLAEYLNTAGVAAQLQSLRPRKSNPQISESSHQITLT